MAVIDINCDMGEGAGNDASIMPHISSANIACGYHAGDERSIWHTIELALQHGVAIGAHVSFLDRANFGRTEMDIPLAEVYDLVTQQLVLINEIAEELGTSPVHVKPHGALYNMAAVNRDLAQVIARAVRDFDRQLLLYGLSGSHSISEAASLGIRTVAEAFADRAYEADGSLVARSKPGALIDDKNKAAAQVLQIVREGNVEAISGEHIPIKAETICIHGDGPHAAEFARHIHQTLTMQGIRLAPISR